MKSESITPAEVQEILTGARLEKFRGLQQYSAQFIARYIQEATLWAFAKGKTYERGFYSSAELSPREQILFHLMVQSLILKMNQTILEGVQAGVIKINDMTDEVEPSQLETRIKTLQARESQLRALLAPDASEVELPDTELLESSLIKEAGLTTILSVFQRALVKRRPFVPTKKK